jgi:DNA-binding NarL/FixJ family response regulator
MKTLTLDSVAEATATEKAKRRVFVVDDHPVFRLGVQQLVNSEPDLEVCGQAVSAAQALAGLRSVEADVVVVDVSLPGANGIELVKQIRAEHEDLPILVLSAHDESQYALRALRAGAGGYLMKSEAADKLLPAVRKVLDGEISVSRTFGEQLIFKVAQGASTGGSPVDSLSDRELEVLELLGAGRSTREMAEALNLSVKTVESHRLHIKDKLGLGHSTELVRFAMDWASHGAAAVP